MYSEPVINWKKTSLFHCQAHYTLSRFVHGTPLNLSIMIKRDFIDKIRLTRLFWLYALCVSPILPFLCRSFLFFFFTGEMSFFSHTSSVLSSPNTLNDILLKYFIHASAVTASYHQRLSGNHGSACMATVNIAYGTVVNSLEITTTELNWINQNRVFKRAMC